MLKETVKKVDSVCSLPKTYRSKHGRRGRVERAEQKQVLETVLLGLTGRRWCQQRHNEEHQQNHKDNAARDARRVERANLGLFGIDLFELELGGGGGGGRGETCLGGQGDGHWRQRETDTRRPATERVRQVGGDGWTEKKKTKQI